MLKKTSKNKNTSKYKICGRMDNILETYIQKSSIDKT